MEIKDLIDGQWYYSNNWCFKDDYAQFVNSHREIDPENVPFIGTKIRKGKIINGGKWMADIKELRPVSKEILKHIKTILPKEVEDKSTRTDIFFNIMEFKDLQIGEWYTCINWGVGDYAQYSGEYKIADDETIIYFSKNTIRSDKPHTINGKWSSNINTLRKVHINLINSILGLETETFFKKYQY